MQITIDQPDNLPLAESHLRAELAIVDQLVLLQTLYGTVIIPEIVAQELSHATSRFPPERRERSR
jgi:predicted nucleic acid-binding protein